MFSLIFLTLAVICITVDYSRSSEPHNFSLLAKISLRYLVLIVTGLGGIFAFMGHAFNPDGIAGKIGWATGSPFQFEVAVANLAFGVVGILSFWVSGTFRVAAATVNAIFLLGCGYGHLKDLLIHANSSPLNTGPTIWLNDLLLPLILLLLAFLEFRRVQNEPQDIQGRK